jgi:hypothetical protein
MSGVARNDNATLRRSPAKQISDDCDCKRVNTRDKGKAIHLQVSIVRLIQTRFLEYRWPSMRQGTCWREGEAKDGVVEGGGGGYDEDLVIDVY